MARKLAGIQWVDSRTAHYCRVRIRIRAARRASPPTRRALAGASCVSFDAGVGLSRKHVNPAALHALAASVDQPHLAESFLERGVEVRIDDLQNLARLEVVQVNGVFDRKNDGLVSRVPRTNRLRVSRSRAPTEL